MKRLLFAALLGFVWLSAALRAEDKPTYTRTEDVVYGRKFGTALTLDVFEPPQKNGAAIFCLVSGGFVSNHSGISPKRYQPLLDRGYTVFAVVHGSQPRFTVPEIVEDINRAIRFVRHNATRWGIDPNKFGINGSSAGGHLSLTLGTQGGPGPADAKDPIDRESSAVQAVACFYPPTDLTNFSRPGELIWEHQSPTPHTPASSFGVKGASRESQVETAKALSPINYVTVKMPPTLVYHGDADKMVPLYQAHMFEKKCQEIGAPFKLLVKVGAGHGGEFGDHLAEMAVFAEWFDTQLRGIKPRG